MKWWAALLLTIALAACKGRDPLQVNNLLGGEVLAVGHGGAGFETARNHLPPNSRASVEQAIAAEGGDGVEIDVQVAADGTLFLYHFDELDLRTSCRGCLTEKLSGELEDCRYDTRYGGLEGSFPLARLDSVMAWMGKRDPLPWIFLNVKTPPACTRQDSFPQLLVDLIHRYGYGERAVVETIDQGFLDAVQAIDSTIKLVYDAVEFEDGLSRTQQGNYWGMALPNHKVTAEQVAEAHASGIYFVIWEVRVLKGTREAVEKAPDVILTDDLRMLRGVLGK